MTKYASKMTDAELARLPKQCPVAKRGGDGFGKITAPPYRFLNQAVNG